MLSWADYSYVQPASSHSYVLIALLAHFVLHENFAHALGSELRVICAGVFIVGHTHPQHDGAPFVLTQVILYILIVFVGTGGELCMSRAMKTIGEVTDFRPRAIARVVGRAMKVPWIWIGIALMALAFLRAAGDAVARQCELCFSGHGAQLCRGRAGRKIFSRRARHSAALGRRSARLRRRRAGRYRQRIAGEGLRDDVLDGDSRCASSAGACAFRLLLARHLRRAAIFSQRKLASAPLSPISPPPVSILKPIRGLDRETYENYASFCRQDYPEFEILFCVTDEQDPAIPVIEQIIRDFPRALDSPADWLRTARRERQSQQALPHGARGAARMLIVSDSDVRVEPGFLRAIVAPFHDPKVGGVTCLYRGLTDGSFAADLEALGNSTDFAPGVLVAWLFGIDVDFMLGAVMATTKKHLAEIGGFESLVDYFCDDYELGNRIAADGHRVELSRFPVSIVYPRERCAEAFRHQLRWNLSIRYSRPWGHLGLIFTQGLPWTVLAAVLAPSAGHCAAYVAAYVVLRGGWPGS